MKLPERFKDARLLTPEDAGKMLGKELGRLARERRCDDSAMLFLYGLAVETNLVCNCYSTGFDNHALNCEQNGPLYGQNPPLEPPPMPTQPLKPQRIDKTVETTFNEQLRNFADAYQEFLDAVLDAAVHSWIGRLVERFWSWVTRRGQ